MIRNRYNYLTPSSKTPKGTKGAQSNGTIIKTLQAESQKDWMRLKVVFW